MNDEGFFDEDCARQLFRAVMCAGGFRITCRSVEIGGCSFDSPDTSPDLSPIRKRNFSPELRKRETEVLPFQRFRGNSNFDKVAEKNAQQLIKEEEQARLKAEKKKAKKQRQKNKKKEASENIQDCTRKKGNTDNNNSSVNEDTINNISNDIENISVNSESKEEEGLDVNAAFVSKAIKKVKNFSVIPNETKNKKEVKDINSILKKVLECENNEDFKEAIQYLTEAINLSPKSYDLILKRSFIYYKLAKFDKSYRDAYKVVEFCPKNADAYLRLGEAHFALSNLTEAEAAFTKLIALNSYCEKAQERLFSIRIKQLEEMGYHPNEAFTALLKSNNKTVDEAIEYLTNLENGKVEEELYYSDEEEDEEESEEEEEEEDSECASGPLNPPINPSNPPVKLDWKSKIFTDPDNPLRCTSLFVTNLKQNITYKEVEDVFAKFGDVVTIKLVTDHNYAFVNFVESGAAGQAMEALQGSRWLLSTDPLVIKYPTNLIKKALAAAKNPELILKKYEPEKKPFTKYIGPVSKPFIGPAVPKPPVTTKKPRPPPKTEECFYWRTTGCVYGDKCFNLHIPAHRGIALHDKKPFTKTTT